MTNEPRCEGCDKLLTDSVEFGGFFWCPLCAELHGATCVGCGTLCERNEMLEIGHWRDKGDSRSWEVDHVELTCLLGWAIDERFRPLMAYTAFTSDVLKSGGVSE